MSTRASLGEILLAQVESHRTEVFYNLDPMRYGSNFIHNLPGCVRSKGRVACCSLSPGRFQRL